MCYNCGKETNNPRFCSRSCSAQVTNREQPKRISNWRCNRCESRDRPSKGSSLCVDCKGKNFVDRTLGEVRLGAKNQHRASLHSAVRYYARLTMRRLGIMVCENCGWSKHVEVAHIRALHTFPDSTRVSEVNHPSNLRVLCPNCHWEFDNTPL